MIRTSTLTAGLAFSAILSACTVIRSSLPNTSEEPSPQTVSDDTLQKTYRDLLNGTTRVASASDCVAQAQREEALAFHPTYFQTEGLTEKASLKLHVGRALAFYQRADDLLAANDSAQRDRIRARQKVLRASLDLLTH